MKYVILALLPILAACGIDGDPVPPSEAKATETGIHLSGSVGIGVSGSVSP